MLNLTQRLILGCVLLGCLTVGLVVATHKALVAAAQLHLAYAVIAAVVVVAAATLFFVLRPIHMLARDAQRIAQGNLEHRVEWSSRDSFGVIAGELSRIAVRLRELRDTEAGRRQMEFQLSDAVLQSIFEPIIVTDGKGHVLKVNQAAEDLLGEAAGDRCKRLWRPKTKHRCCRCGSASRSAAIACAQRPCATQRGGCWAL
jgi:nitrogen fixation/metabolism regulation signal transduction histidine kinase